MSKLAAVAKILKDRFPNLSVMETIEIAEKILAAERREGAADSEAARV